MDSNVASYVCGVEETVRGNLKVFYRAMSRMCGKYANLNALSHDQQMFNYRDVILKALLCRFVKLPT